MANQIAVRQARAFHWPIQDREAHNFHESSTMEFCYREAAKSLGYPTLKDEREKVLSKFLEGNDVFVSLPTGYGKSLSYAALPHAFDLKRFGSMEPVCSVLVYSTLARECCGS